MLENEINILKFQENLLFKQTAKLFIPSVTRKLFNYRIYIL